MLNSTILRYRYTQLFILFILCFLTYFMARSMGATGINNFEDNLYKKDFLIETAIFLRMKIGDRVFPQVLLEKDGWMGHITEREFDYYQNARLFKNQPVIVKELVNLNQYLKSQGITLYLVAAPSKATIYPDKVPEQIKSLPVESRLDSLISDLEDNHLPLLLDLRPALSAARQNQDVYYKTNTHWNGYGAFVAYTTIINTLASSYPELKPYKAADMKLVTTDPEAQDLTVMMHANFIKEPSFFFVPKDAFVQTLDSDNYLGYNQFSSTSDCSLPTLLMFHDSFGEYYLNDYLSMNFAKSHFVYNNGIRKYLTPESLRQFKPDIVIIEILERNLGMLENHLSNFASE
jgi:alginate O-acetyltransferase complex protein AlgJ